MGFHKVELYQNLSLTIGFNVSEGTIKYLAQHIENSTKLEDFQFNGIHLISKQLEYFQDDRLDMQIMLKSVSRNKTIKNLTLKNSVTCPWRITTDPSVFTRSISQIIRNNTTITSLDISEHTLGKSRAFEPFAKALEQNNTITSLSMRGMDMGDDIAILFFESLNKNKTLLHLDLTDNQIGAQKSGKCKLTPFIAGYIANCRLISLSLGKNPLISCFSDILTALQLNKTIQRINLEVSMPNEINYGKKCMEAIEGLLKRDLLASFQICNFLNGGREIKCILNHAGNNLTELILQFCDFDNSACSTFKSAFPSSKIEHLDMSGSKMSNTIEIFDGLRKSRCLKSLTMSNMTYSRNFAIGLSKFVEKTMILQVLNLSSLNCTEGYFFLLQEFFARVQSQSIHTLILSGSILQNSSIYRDLGNWKSLTHLDISNNLITSLDGIAEMIENENCRLKTIIGKMSNEVNAILGNQCSISEGSLAKFFGAVKKNGTLQKINFCQLFSFDYGILLEKKQSDRLEKLILCLEEWRRECYYNGIEFQY